MQPLIFETYFASSQKETQLLELVTSSRTEKRDPLPRNGRETGALRAGDSHSKEFRGLEMKQGESVQSAPTTGATTSTSGWDRARVPDRNLHIFGDLLGIANMPKHHDYFFI